jgi:hypothetical protein
VLAHPLRQRDRSALATQPSPADAVVDERRRLLLLPLHPATTSRALVVVDVHITGILPAVSLTRSISSSSADAAAG